MAKSFDIETDWEKLLVYKVAEEAGFNAPSFGRDFDAAMNEIGGSSGCYWGPIPYRAAGYSEGLDFTGPLILIRNIGSEVVYDFGKMEQGQFSYYGSYLSDSLAGMPSVSETAVHIEGFTSWRNDIASDYGGLSQVMTGGAGLNVLLETGLSIGVIASLSLGDIYLNGHGSYIGLPPRFGVDGWSSAVLVDTDSSHTAKACCR